MSLCSVAFCPKNKSNNRAFFYFHWQELKKNNIKKFKELLPIWALKRCKIHGLLRPSQCETHHQYGSLICKLCRRDNRKNTSTTNHQRERFRHNNFRFKYGITVNQYNELLKLQNNVCAICHKKDKSKNLAVDHCHKSNKVRGLLCSSCNRALGFFNDSIELLNKAAQYLCR